MANLANYKEQNLFNKCWVFCKESRIESQNSFYGSFYIGPFDESLSQTLAHNIRRTLLSELSGLAITSVEIEGVLHKFSNVPGMQETVLDILCNLQNIVFRKKNVYPAPSTADLRPKRLQTTEIGYLRLRGPGVVKASDILLPAGIECVNPDQYIATLAEDGIFNMKIFINEGQNYIKQKQKNSYNGSLAQTNVSKFNTLPGDQKKTTAEGGNSAAIPERKTNRIYLDSVFMPVTKVNTIVQLYNSESLKHPTVDKLTNLYAPKAFEGFAPQNRTQNSSGFKSFFTTSASSQNTSFGGAESLLNANTFGSGSARDNSDLFVTTDSAPLAYKSEISKSQNNQKCQIILEIWTNGSIHPRQALYDCLGFLSNTFVTLENLKMLGSMFKTDLSYSAFGRAKKDK